MTCARDAEHTNLDPVSQASQPTHHIGCQAPIAFGHFDLGLDAVDGPIHLRDAVRQDGDLQAAALADKPRPWNMSTGSTTGGSMASSAWSRQPNSRPATIM